VCVQPVGAKMNLNPYPSDLKLTNNPKSKPELPSVGWTLRAVCAQGTGLGVLAPAQGMGAQSVDNLVRSVV
jgi:hypothetical protein